MHANTGTSVRLAVTAADPGKMMVESVTQVILGMWSSRERMHIIRISWQMLSLAISGVERSSFMLMKMIWGTDPLKTVLRPDIRGHELDARSLGECEEIVKKEEEESWCLVLEEIDNIHECKPGLVRETF